MRLAVVLPLLLAAALAGEPELTEEQRADVVQLVGAEAWGLMPKWRQDVVLARYARFLQAPERKRAAIERRGLQRFLLQAEPAGEDDLPPALRAEIDETPPPLRTLAKKLAFMRVRQIRLDRSLGHVPPALRWELFRRLFPEPFDQERARAAYLDLRGWQVKGAAAEMRRAMEGRELSKEERVRWVRRAAREEEERVVAQVRGELQRLRGLDLRRARRLLEVLGLLDDARFVTPRQRELIRYALRPEKCPLLDLSYLGPRPAEPAARRAWERDFRLFARMELLFEAGFNRETVLHLASTGSPEDFLRALKALRHPQQPPNSERGNG